MRHHHLGLLANGLGGHLGRERQAGHQAVDLGSVGADQETNGVPVSRQSQGCDGFQGLDHRSERGHSESGS